MDLTYLEIQKMKEELGLTDKQKKLCDFYWRTKNKTQSCIYAYGKITRGNETNYFKSEKVQEYLKLLELEQEHSTATPTELKIYLTSILRSNEEDNKTKMQCIQHLVKLMDLNKDFKNDKDKEIIINTDYSEEE